MLADLFVPSLSQIKQECDKFGASSEIKNTCVYGGVPKRTQVRNVFNISHHTVTTQCEMAMVVVSCVVTSAQWSLWR